MANVFIITKTTSLLLHIQKFNLTKSWQTDIKEYPKSPKITKTRGKKILLTKAFTTVLKIVQIKAVSHNVISLNKIYVEKSPSLPHGLNF